MRSVASGIPTDENDEEKEPVRLSAPTSTSSHATIARPSSCGRRELGEGEREAGGDQRLREWSMGSGVRIAAAVAPRALPPTPPGGEARNTDVEGDTAARSASARPLFSAPSKALHGSAEPTAWCAGLRPRPGRGETLEDEDERAARALRRPPAADGLALLPAPATTSAPCRLTLRRRGGGTGAGLSAVAEAARAASRAGTGECHRLAAPTSPSVLLCVDAPLALADSGLALARNAGGERPARGAGLARHGGDRPRLPAADPRIMASSRL